ncbi:hypothetical protein [Escherichia phage KW1E_UTAR]|nr:hypothetical protein [Escherichia phage KW1E_UTAR]
MKKIVIALSLALLTSTAANAVVITKPRDYTPENSGALNAQAVNITPGKKIGFVTCGGNNFGGAGSLGCKDYQAKDKPTIPWTAYPGYRLGAAIPASYRVTGISFDSYNHSATIYFEY